MCGCNAMVDVSVCVVVMLCFSMCGCNAMVVVSVCVVVMLWLLFQYVWL